MRSPLIWHGIRCFSCRLVRVLFISVNGPGQLAASGLATLVSEKADSQGLETFVQWWKDCAYPLRKGSLLRKYSTDSSGNSEDQWGNDPSIQILGHRDG